MNYIKHLAGFFDRIALDHRLNPSHVSMYVSIFRFWNANRFENPISIARSEIMAVSKISSKGTYHKCIKQLNDYGYLKYVPSYNPFKGSLVYLFDFQSDTEQAPVRDTNFYSGSGQVVGRHHTKKEEGGGQALGPSINTININKHKNIVNRRSSEAVLELNMLSKKEKEKSSAKKEKADGTEVPTTFGIKRSEIPMTFGNHSANKNNKNYGEPL